MNPLNASRVNPGGRASSRAVTRPDVLSILLVALLLWTPGASAATPNETNVIKAARAAFQDGFYSYAESGFSNFVVLFPQSPDLPSAILYQARSALNQERFQPAADLLTTNMSKAGALTDQFQFWLGRVQFDSGQAAAAADTFAKVASTFTNSPIRLEAAVQEAQARFSLSQWPRVVSVIESSGGPFQVAAAARGSNDPLVIRGVLLSARALAAQGELKRAEQALSRIGEAVPDQRLRWERLFLLAEVQTSARRLAEALTTSSNLVAAAGNAADLRSASVAVQGGILHALGRLPDATKAFELNLAATAPAERRREAFVRTVELALEQNLVSNAVARLESYLAASPADAASDVALLTVAELRLKQHQVQGAPQPAPGTTNQVELAIADLNRLIQSFPRSPFIARAQLARGWAMLVQLRNADAAAAFSAAADGLEYSEAQAVARFKLADIQFASGSHSNAIANYRRVVNDYQPLPRVQQQLVDRALYQMLQAAIAVNDLQAANEAARRVADDFPQSNFADRSLLLYGQMFTDLGRPSDARHVFNAALQRWPDSEFAPEVKLAVARSYEKEREWSAAAEEYSRWLEQFATNKNRAEAEFRRAFATYQSGAESNALTYFTNFVVRYSNNVLSARAQNWIGDYHFARGMLSRRDEDFREAEKSYQLVAAMLGTLRPQDELRFAAQLKAGRAAFRRQSWSDAIAYFVTLLNNSNTPPSVAAEASFAYADTYVQQPNTNELDRFTTARNIVALIPKDYPNETTVARAWGRMADFSFQIGGLLSTNKDPEGSIQAYRQAYENYSKVTNSPLADINAIALAEIGMGNVRRREAASADADGAVLNGEALKHYLNVVYVPNDEHPDPALVREAAMKAAQLSEEQKEWGRAVELYRRVGEMMPVLRAAMDRRAAMAREQQALQKQ
jgi:TolA-binding protein